MSEKKPITLKIEDKLKHETINFILDTNTIRFKNGASEHEDRNEAVKEFFKYTDTHKETYNFVVPWQVGSELRIYIYRVRELHKDNEELLKNVANVEEYLKEIEFVKCKANEIQEEEIRTLFEYLKANYEFTDENGGRIKLNSLKTDDARILLTAIQEDVSIITHNVKDFMPVLAFEKAIWNPVNDKIYRLTDDAHKVFKEDETLQNWLSSISSSFVYGISDEEEQRIIDGLK